MLHEKFSVFGLSSCHVSFAITCSCWNVVASDFGFLALVIDPIGG
jgi:hypothetical protein